MELELVSAPPSPRCLSHRPDSLCVTGASQELKLDLPGKRRSERETPYPTINSINVIEPEKTLEHKQVQTKVGEKLRNEWQRSGRMKNSHSRCTRSWWQGVGVRLARPSTGDTGADRGPCGRLGGLGCQSGGLAATRAAKTKCESQLKLNFDMNSHGRGTCVPRTGAWLRAGGPKTTCCSHPMEQLLLSGGRTCKQHRL